MARLSTAMASHFPGFEIRVKHGFLHVDVKEHPSQFRSSHSVPPAFRQKTHATTTGGTNASDSTSAHPLRFTLRRHNCVPLGLEFSNVFAEANQSAQSLVVLAVIAGGAVDSWNRMCSDEMRMVKPGDRIVQINEACTPASMIEEQKDKLLLKMVVVLGSGHRSGSSIDSEFRCHHTVVPAPSTKSVLNIFASEFCPQSACAHMGCSGQRPEPTPPTTPGSGASRASDSDNESESVRRCLSWAESDEGSNGESEEDLQQALPVRPRAVVQWSEDAKRLRGKKTRMTKSLVSALGEYTCTIYPICTKDAQGGRSFSAARGRGTVEVKCSSESPNEAVSLVAVSIGDGMSRQVFHNFASDGLVCRVPGTWHFEEAVNKNSDMLTVTFEFEASH